MTDDQENISRWVTKLTDEGKYKNKDKILAVAYGWWISWL